MASVATVYAKALFLEAKSNGSLEASAQDLREFRDLLRASPSLQRVFGSLIFDADLRSSLADELAQKSKFGPVASRFLKILARNNRMLDLDSILLAFHNYWDEDSGVLRGELWSAVEIPTVELEEIASSIGRRLGRQVQLVERQDESLLGGFVARVGGRTFDSSLKTQLHNLKEACIREF